MTHIFIVSSSHEHLELIWLLLCAFVHAQFSVGEKFWNLDAVNPKNIFKFEFNPLRFCFLRVAAIFDAISFLIGEVIITPDMLQNMLWEKRAGFSYDKKAKMHDFTPVWKFTGIHTTLPLPASRVAENFCYNRIALKTLQKTLLKSF